MNDGVVWDVLKSRGGGRGRTVAICIYDGKKTYDYEVYGNHVCCGIGRYVDAHHCLCKKYRVLYKNSFG